MNGSTVVFNSSIAKDKIHRDAIRKEGVHDRDQTETKTYSVAASSLVQQSVKPVKVKIDADTLKKAVKD